MSERVAIVIIGRNEGDRLRRSLESVCRHRTSIVYVDSGSVDGSVTLARSMGIKTIELDAATPFTAARARNEGLAHVMEQIPGLSFVQFLDGDCELADDWIERGVTEFSLQPDVAVVFGAVRERSPDASVYNRICDMEWRSAVGIVDGCGGIALMRVSSLLKVGGFNASTIAGEDTELCARLRAQGWKILHVAVEMAMHDSAMTRISQWWKRAQRAGRGFAQFSRFRGAEADRFFFRQARSTWFWACMMPLTVLVVSLLLRSWALLLLVGYPVLTCRIYCRMRRGGTNRTEAMIYAIHCTAAKFPQMVGVVGYHMNRLWPIRSGDGDDQAPQCSTLPTKPLAVRDGRTPPKT